MPEHGPCEICGNQAEYVLSDFFPGRRCPRCGEFDYDTSVGWRKITSPDEMVQLSGWVREQNAAGVVPVRITPERAARTMLMPMPGLRERANRVLSILAKEYFWQLFDKEIVARRQDIQGISYSSDEMQLFCLLSILEDEACFRKTPAGYYVSTHGMLVAEALGASRSNAAQGFVAMWFNDDLRDAWTNGFDPGIRAAGYHPFRIDNKDYVGGITDEIMAEVRRSRFVVADYTGQVNGVYFEAGFALGLGLTVIPTCRADEIPKLHFDIKHLNTLLWNTPAELSDGLNRRIRAVIGAGPDAADP
jgi:hypothetical protein